MNVAQIVDLTSERSSPLGNPGNFAGNAVSSATYTVLVAMPPRGASHGLPRLSLAFTGVALSEATQLFQDLGGALISIVSESVRAELLRRPVPYCTFIASLAVPGLSLKRPVPVTIRPSDDGFIASFLDANISIGEDTVAEAIASLQSMIADAFNDLEQVDNSTLWPPMIRQKQALLDVVCRT